MKLKAERILSGELKPGDLFLCEDGSVNLLYFEQDRWKWTHSIGERVFIRTEEATDERDIPVYRITIETQEPSDLEKLFVASYFALRSYENHNSSPELAEEIANEMQPLFEKMTGGCTVNIENVYIFENGMCAVFGEDGQQMENYQGEWEKRREMILRDAPESAKFWRTVGPGWGTRADEVKRKDLLN